MKNKFLTEDQAVDYARSVLDSGESARILMDNDGLYYICWASGNWPDGGRCLNVANVEPPKRPKRRYPQSKIEAYTRNRPVNMRPNDDEI